MELEEGPHCWDESSAPSGRFFLQLATVGSWAARRVENVELIDFHTVQRKISIDIDVHKLAGIATNSRLAYRDYLHVPVAILEKGLLSDIDISVRGEIASIATSTRDSGAAQLALIALLASGFHR